MNLKDWSDDQIKEIAAKVVEDMTECRRNRPNLTETERDVFDIMAVITAMIKEIT